MRVTVDPVLGGSEICLAPSAPVAGPPVTVYCVGELRMPDAVSTERLAKAIYAHHHARPDGVILWHMGADTPNGGLLGDAFRRPDGASIIAAFLRDAGDYGLWWPETWRNVSRHLLARPVLAGLSVVLLQDRIDRAPHYWGDDARDDLGKTLSEELARRGRLGLEVTLKVVGEGERCFADHPGVLCTTVIRLIESMETAPEHVPGMVTENFTIEIDGLGDARAEVHDDWRLRDLKREPWRHLLYPNRSVAASERCPLMRVPGVDAARIGVRIRQP
jgi:hypothetical protein